MAKKGTIFNTYSNEIKLSAVQSYLNGKGSYDMIVEKYQILVGKNSEMKGIPNPFKKQTDSF